MKSTLLIGGIVTWTIVTGEVNGDELAAQVEVRVGGQRMQQLSHARNVLSRKEQTLGSGEQCHGRVWLFLRK
jgi:predicted thioesterase